MAHKSEILLVLDQLMYYCAFNSSSNVTVSPQDIAIPVSNITNGTDGRPILTFYAQLSSDTVMSSDVLTAAVEVRIISYN